MPAVGLMSPATVLAIVVSNAVSVVVGVVIRRHHRAVMERALWMPLLRRKGCLMCGVAGGRMALHPGVLIAPVNLHYSPYEHVVWLNAGTGLTQYAVYQALKKTIPRTADTQYHSSMGKHIPRSEAKAGDLIFWGEGGDCSSSGAVAHVGIFMRDGWMVNAAHTGTPVREQSIWTSSGGESICPDAVRYVDF